ncbi:MAG: hypothetical protein R3B72_50330 [Polyangiaceae bacterium]
MPLLERLDYVAQGGLRVAYRASPTVQDLDVLIVARGVPSKGAANWYLQNLVDVVNAGGAGGSLFPPSNGFMEMTAGPTSDAEALRADHRATFRVASVAPLFLRTIVEDLRYVNVEEPVVELSIAGSLPVDDTDLSVTERDVRGWLDDPLAYLPAWPSPGFPIDFDDPREGAGLRIVLEDPITPALRDALEELSVRWLCAIRNYVGFDGREVEPNPGLQLPRFGQGRREFRAAFDEFRWARQSSRDVIVNLLTRFHERVARIAEVEVAL